MKRISQCIAVAAGVLSTAWAQPAGPSLKQRIAAIMSRPEYVHARFGMEFWPLDADKPAYRLNEQQFFIAASTTKLLTEGAALSLLGPEYRFHTRVFRTGAIAPRVGRSAALTRDWHGRQPWGSYAAEHGLRDRLTVGLCFQSGREILEA